MKKPALWGLAVALACAAGGCRSSSPSHDSSSWSYSYRASEPEAPSLGLSHEQVARALEKQRIRSTERHEQALDLIARVKDGDTATVATAVSACFALGDRDVGCALASGERGVWTFDKAAPVAEVACHYKSRGAFSGGALEVTVKRKPGVEGPLAIAFPPGTYGVASDVAADDDGWTRPDDDRRYGDWPSQQDLGFLRAPVLYLDADQSEDSLVVPIACASFRSGPPRADQTYALRRFEPGSDADRLLCAVCARQKTSEPEAQLALWIARNNISWGDFVSKGGAYGGLLTFGHESRILPRHGKGAAKLLVSAGVNPCHSPFFADAEPNEAFETDEPVPAPVPAAGEKPANATP